MLCYQAPNLDRFTRQLRSLQARCVNGKRITADSFVEAEELALLDEKEGWVGDNDGMGKERR